MRARLLLAAVLVALVAVAGAAGCQKIRSKIGMGTTISSPDPGTPEKVIQDVLKAARMSDEADGWVAFSMLLHSQESSSPAAMNEWQTMRFPTMRRKVDFLLVDKAALVYKLMDKREEGKELKVYVNNSQSDMPTPCTLRRDPEQNNAWRVFNACF